MVLYEINKKMDGFFQANDAISGVSNGAIFPPFFGWEKLSYDPRRLVQIDA